MKVVMLCMTRYNSRFVNKGDIVEMDPTSANRMMGRGLCKIVEEPKKKSKNNKKNKVKDIVEDVSAVDTGPNEGEDDFISEDED